MATFYSNSDRGYSLVLEVTQVGQDKARNQSTVRSKLTLRNTNVTFAQYTVTGTMVINGTTHNYSGRPSMLSNNSSIVLLDKTQTVGHNSNGTKTITVSASVKGSGGWSPGTLSIGNKSFKLSDIHRASKVTGSDVFVGNQMSISIQSYDSSFTHHLRYRFGSLSGYIVKGIKGTYNWQVPATFAEQLPNVTSGRGTVWCETYSGSSKIGESQFDFTLRVPEDYRPSLTDIDLLETQSMVGKLALGANTFVQILSDVQVTFGGASGIYGSTIVSYKAEMVGKNQSVTENQGRFGLMNFSGEAIVRASVTDSRGRTSNVIEKTITVLPYHPPIFNFTAIRSGGQNTTITISRNAKIAPLIVGNTQKNKMTLSFKVAPYGENNYTTNLSNASGTYSSLSSLVNSQANLSGTYDTTKSFEIIGILEDSFTSAEFKVVVGTEQYVYTYDQHGMGIMKARERGALDVSGDIYMNNLKLIDIFYPVGSIYESTRPINPEIIMGGTWERFGNGQVLVGIDERDPDFNTPNKTGGEKEHRLTVDELPNHSHGIRGAWTGGSTPGSAPSGGQWAVTQKQFYDDTLSKSVGGNQPHNNLQPYVTVYRWHRTA